MSLKWLNPQHSKKAPATEAWQTISSRLQLHNRNSIWFLTAASKIFEQQSLPGIQPLVMLLWCRNNRHGEDIYEKVVWQDFLERRGWQKPQNYPTLYRDLWESQN